MTVGPPAGPLGPWLGPWETAHFQVEMKRDTVKDFHVSSEKLEQEQLPAANIWICSRTSGPAANIWTCSRTSGPAANIWTCSKHLDLQQNIWPCSRTSGPAAEHLDLQ